MLILGKLKSISDIIMWNNFASENDEIFKKS